jgi:peptidyl-prolyl cis-trans isomerase D
MFNLFRSRSKAVKYLIGAIMMLVALSMVITLVPGFMGASYSSGDPTIVAEIGDEVITIREVSASLQQQLQNNQIPREMAANYVPMIVNQMVSEYALAYEAERMGFEVSDADVAQAVQSMIPALFQGGQFVGEEAYAQYLSQMNLTIPQFEGNVRKRMLLLKVANLALEGEIVTDEQIEEEFRNANEKVQIEFVTFASADYRSQVKVTAAEMKAHYDANLANYRIGEKRDARILVVDQDEVASKIEMPDEELRKLYQAETDRFRTPERVMVRHILLKTTDKSDEQKQEARTKIDDLLAQLKGGADFAELAEANSEDTGSAVEGGDLGWIARGQTVANFEKAAFSLEPNSLSEVIETEYGFHIVEVKEKETARLQPFEDVKDQLAEEKKRQFVYDRIQQLADEARAELIQNPTQPEAVAAQLGISVLTVDQIGATDPVPEASPDMRAAFMELEVAGVTQVYEIGQDRLGVATVTAIYPERQAELSEVEDQIRQQLITEKANALYQEKRQLIANVVTAAEGDLKKIASSIGAKIQTSEEINRGGTVEGFGGAVYVKDVFEAEVGDLVGPVDAMGRTIVAKLIKKTPADLTLLALERTDILDRLQAQRARERRELFEDGIVAKLITEGKLKINDATIQRLVSNYTG